MTGTSAIYVGEVVHQRHRPARHRLRYKVFSLLLDLDDLDDLHNRLWLFAHNRAAPISFWDKDYGAGESGALREWVERHLVAADIETFGLRIRILCYPRIFGYVFNPLSVYFCEASDGRLLAILYEVSNTFGERHTYVVPVRDGAGSTVHHSCAKEMYVSPFMPMDCIYKFHIYRPSDQVVVAIDESDGEGPLLHASFAGRRRHLTELALARVLLALPMMTMKIMIGIHWEALRLWLKGVPIHRREPNPGRRTSSLVGAKD